MNNFRTCVFLSVFFLTSTVWGQPSLKEIWRNNQAVEHLKQKKVIEAHDEFKQLLSQSPFSPLFQFNLGFSFISVEEMEKAIQMYKEILKLKPLSPEIEFPTLYNLGVLNGMKGEVDEALRYYQEALAFVPDSNEIKTNIELLFKGQGGGKGDKKNKDKKKGDDEDEQKEPKEFTNKPQQPNQFDNKEMSKGDVKKILEELKKQEQRIRAKHQRKGGREADRDKNW
ncbi:MAG: tetratricopeptide repeat protein [Pseudomonadota bacterium]